jgi:glycosyltransferase involved in cell wall biosynthesis
MILNNHLKEKENKDTQKNIKKDVSVKTNYNLEYTQNMGLKLIGLINKKGTENKEVIRKKFNNLKFSVIIPLYNEENSIQNVLKNIPNHFCYEIIVVNDGSTDRSIEKVRELKDERIRIVNHQKNRGYGAAVLSGIEKATGKIIITLDADGQHDPKEIPKLIKPILSNKADLVVGSRYLGKCSYKVPLHTRVGELLIEKFLRLFFNQRVKNNQSGFRAFEKKHSYLFRKLHFTGFGFCTEILLKAGLKDLKIREVPITMKRRKSGISYVKLPTIGTTIFLSFIIYCFKRIKLIKVIPNLIRDTARRRLLELF